MKEEYKGGLVRLDEVHEVPLQHLERLSVNVPLPSNVGAERIGIDVARLETICRIAGIRELGISTFSPEESVVGVVGGGPDADGAMSMTRVFSIAPALAADSFWNRLTEIKALRSILTEIQLNIEGILGKVADESKIGIRDVQKVADVMDFQLRKHLLLSGLKFLLADVQHHDMGLLFTRLSNLVTTFAIATIGALSVKMDPTELGILVAAGDLAMGVACNVIAIVSGKMFGEKARLTFLQGYVAELDRALVLALRLGLGGRLIDVVDEGKEV